MPKPTTTMDMDIGRQRLYYQRLTHSTFKDAADVAAWFGAMQGQDYLGTKWAFGARLPHTIEQHIDQFLNTSNVYRIWGLRGTLHYVAPTDVHWLLGLIAPRIIASNALRYKQLGLDDITLSRSSTFIAEALQNGKHLTRTELFKMLQAHGISTDGQRGVYMLQRAGLERLLYQGPMCGKDTTFLALGEGKLWPLEQAAAELARRYFYSHGPSTLADFTYWAGLHPSDARLGLAAIQAELDEIKVDGQTYFRSKDVPIIPDHTLHLLPGFDEYILGYKDRSAVLDKQIAQLICPGGNGMFSPTIISQGQVIGTWKRVIKAQAVHVSLYPIRPLDNAEIEALEMTMHRSPIRHKPSIWRIGGTTDATSTSVWYVAPISP